MKLKKMRNERPILRLRFDKLKKNEDRVSLMKRLSALLGHQQQTGKPAVHVDARGRAYFVTTWGRKTVHVPLSSLPVLPNRLDRRKRSRALTRAVQHDAMRRTFRGIVTRRTAYILNNLPKVT